MIVCTIIAWTSLVQINLTSFNMTAEEVKCAWDNNLPVEVCRPNEAPFICEMIVEVIYWKQNGRKRVSCVCRDKLGNLYRVRQNDLKLLEAKNDTLEEAN